MAVPLRYHRCLLCAHGPVNKPSAGAGAVTSPPRTLQGGGLLLRPYRAGDEAAVHEAAVESITEVAPYETWCHDGFTLEEAAAYARGWEESWQRGHAFYFAVLHEATARYLGSCGLCPVERDHGTAGLGFWVRTSAAGRGVATAASRLVAGFGLEQLVLHRIELLIAVGNAPSRRVAEKIGAVYEGTLRKRLVLQGVPTDMAMYAVVR